MLTKNWHKYIQIQTSFVGDVNMPVNHIGSEKFVKSSNAAQFEIDRDLFFLMQDPEDSATIIANLIATYLAPFGFQHKINFNDLNPYRDKTLRDYQIEGKAKIYQMWTQMRSIMYQMPTGTGKTKLFVSIARDLFDWGAQRKTAVKILFLAHRIELLDQISENLGIKYNLAHAMIASQNREQKNYPLQIASVQTLIRRLDRWTDKDFDVIIIDEAHHVKADSYKKILRAFPRAKVLGVTATPYRMSHESFRPEFDELITSAPVAKFIKDKWLCDYEYYSIRPESRIQMDINSISRFALDGDYLDEAAADILDKDEIRAGIVSTYERYAKGKKGIIYTITKAHNAHICSQFISKGYKAVAIDDKTPAETRKQYVDDFRRGKIEIICNVNIFSEGFDCPDLEFIQLARPTKSLSMYLQQVGRGLRPAEGKDKLIILDNVGLYNRFGFPSARRHWRRHFEGLPVDYTDPFGSRSVDGRFVSFIDDFEEGNEEVEMLHTTTEEVVEETPITEDTVVQNSNEPEFRFYLRKSGKDDAEIRRIIRGIKSDIDSLIRGKYDSKHDSILKMENIGALELYLFDFQSSPVMAELNTVKRNIMTDALTLYIDYLKWRESDGIEITTNIAETDSDIQDTEPVPARSLQEVETEINIFRKWNRDVPEGLLEEYQRLLNS
jgi:superfamily II DNA or RNA helicase